MATEIQRRAAGELQMEVSVHWSTNEAPVVARLDQVQARELIARLSLLAPGDTGVVEAMKGTDPARLMLGLQAFHRIVLERGECIALADVHGSLWTIPARSVSGIRVRAVRPTTPAAAEPDADLLRRVFAPVEDDTGSC